MHVCMYVCMYVCILDVWVGRSVHVCTTCSVCVCVCGVQIMLCGCVLWFAVIVLFLHFYWWCYDSFAALLILSIVEMYSRRLQGMYVRAHVE